MPTNVLLIGGGGREHALARAISRSPTLGTLYATHTSNPGIAALAEPIDVPVSKRELYRLEWFCEKNDVGLVVIGPEDPLAEGYADTLRKGGRLVFGPSAMGARLEADKAWSKKLMRSASIPTAEGRIFSDPEAACEYLRSRDEPHVIKAAGLAKGKGVILPSTLDEGIEAIDRIMRQRVFGDAGSEVVIEEKLSGPEVSVLCVTDGETLLVLPPCQDHKRLLDADAGPNTGGMGAFCPSGSITDDVMGEIETEILVPTLDALKREEIDYSGVLYAGLMLTPAGPKVLEFNCRFGDPECQPLMARLESDAIELLSAPAAGNLAEQDVRWRDGAAVCVVLASGGYPDNPVKGAEITGVEEAEAMDGVVLDHAGTSMQNGKLVTSGGRVLGVTGLGDTLAEARDRAYQASEMIRFEGRQMRSDIASGAPVGA